MSKDSHKAWGGNWYRGGANWLENRLNNTLDKDEEHDDRVMVRDAMTKLNQAADEIDRLYQIEKERDFLISEYERAVKCGPQGFAHAAGHIYNAIVNAQCEVNTGHFIEMRNQRDAALEREQALAAHVERLKIALDNILNEVGTHSHDDLSDDERQALSALEAAPTISLARHDALKQMYAAVCAANECGKLRQQAEALNDRPS